MADVQTSLRRRGTVMRIAGGVLALLFATVGVALALVAIAIGALNIAPIRVALLEAGLRQLDTGDTVIRIDDIGGEWPRRLTLEGVSIADGDGEWLTLTRAALEWNPNALWRGDVRVTTLETEGLSLARLPGGDETTDTSGDYTLPSLPVDIHLDHFAARDTQIGRSVIGEEISFNAEGDVIYSSSRMKLTLDAARSDGKTGEVKAALDYLTGPQRGTLALDLRDGTPGQRGIAARLVDLDGLSALTLSAKGEMRDGLMTGALSLDGGRALRAHATTHGGWKRGTSLAVKLEAGGAIVAEQLAFADDADEISLAARLTPKRRGAYQLDIDALEAGPLALTGAAMIAPQRLGGWNLESEGSLSGADRIAGIEADTFLKEVRWRAVGSANAALDAFNIAEARLMTEAGDLHFSGNAATGENGLILSGDGAADITDLRPVSALAGQSLQGTAELSFSGVSFARGRGLADITIETSAIDTDSAGLDALLAQGLAGAARIGFGGGTTVSVTELSLQAGRQLDVTGAFSLADSGTLRGDARVSMTDLGAILGDTARGALSAEASVSGAIEKPSLTLDATLSDGALGGFDARQASFTARLQEGKGPLAFRLSGRDGTATLDTALTLPGDGSARFDEIAANLFGARLDGAIAVSPDGLAEGNLSADRMNLTPIGALAGLAMEGRANLDITLEARGGKQDAAIAFSSRRIDIELTAPTSLDRVALNATLTDLAGDGAVEAVFTADSGGSGNTRFTEIEASATGPLDRIEISARVAGERLSLNTETMSLSLEALLEPSLLTVSTLDARTGSATATLGAPVKVELGGGLTRLRNLDMRFDSEDGAGSLTGDMTLRPRAATIAVAIADMPLMILSPLLPFEVLGGTLSGSLALDSGQENATASFRFSKAMLAEAGFEAQPAFDATFDAEWARRRLSLRAEAHGASETPFRLTAALPLIRDPQGAFPILPERGPVEAQLTWDGPAASLMALADTPGQRLTGDADVALSAEGDISAPLVSGHVRLRNGTFENFSTGTLLSNLTVDIEGARSETLSFRMSASDGGAGRLTGEGTVSLAADTSPAVDIHTRFDDMHVVTRRDLVLAVEGDLSLTGTVLPPDTENPLKLEGTLTTTEARYLIPKQLPGGVSHIDVIIVQGPDDADAVDEPAAEAPLPLALDVTLAIGNPPARVAGRGVDSLWVGSVRVTGLAEDPVVRGTIRSERGTLDFAGKTFILSHGVVTFAGEQPIDPALDIALDYERNGFSATVALGGRGSSPKINLSSSPSLPRDEIISRILFEKGVGELTAFEAAQLANTAAELSGGGIGGFGLLSGVQNSLGLDVLRVDQGSSGGATVSAGKYLREGVYVGVEQGALASDSGVTVEIDITDNISVQTKVGNDASSDVGVNWKWDY